MPAGRDVWITGIGLASALGDGHDDTWASLMAGGDPSHRANTEYFPPYPVFDCVDLDLSTQIPKRGDQRQMEPFQRFGVYAAGLALDDAGAKGDADLLDRMDMIVAAGGGERDIDVDEMGLQLIADRGAIDPALNELLANNLRPTLFLAQLPNLLAGNISIVHGVAGSSRTFMGEEIAGCDAVRVAHSRIAAGQGDIALVGGSMNALRPDIFLMFEADRQLWRGAPIPVWQRAADDAPGMILGSGGAFLVIEAAEHAKARGARAYAKLSAVSADRTRRNDGDVVATARAQWLAFGYAQHDGALAVLSGATGAAPATVEEQVFLNALANEHRDVAIRAAGSWVGNLVEGHFPFSIALAALSVAGGELFPPADETGLEQAPNGAVEAALVTGIGHWRGEGFALVENAEGH